MGSPTVSASEITGRWTGPSDAADAEAPAKGASETWGEKVYAALPLFIVGGACLAVAVDFYVSSATTPLIGNSSVRLAPWMLFLALAVTGLSAGLFALIMEDEEPTSTREVSPAVRPTPAPPAWDESTVTPSQPTYPKPRTWEQYALGPEDFVGWSPAEPQVERVSPDVVLVQIDEIAASLRKKSPPSRTS